MSEKARVPAAEPPDGEKIPFVTRFSRAGGSMVLIVPRGVWERLKWLRGDLILIRLIGSTAAMRKITPESIMPLSAEEAHNAAAAMDQRGKHGQAPGR